MSASIRQFLPLLFLIGNGSVAVVAEEPQIDFERQIAPLLETKCLGCHSPGIAKGEVSLDRFDDLKEAGHVVPGNPGSSYLIDLVTAEDPEDRMPQEGDPLTAAEVMLLRTWIKEGATWPSDVVLRERSKADHTWWALQPVTPPKLLPSGADASRLETVARTIDALIDAKLQEKGLAANDATDRQTLIRRVTYDLIGLPPTPEEVREFVDDPDPNAYEKLIDRLLASPHYGERWGRHWLDVVRFGESNGFERNILINELWPFRDYVIRSLNADKPFDQFIREHLAGDVIAPGDPQIETGSAFLVAGPYDNVGNSDAEAAAQIRADTIDEMIRATGSSFMGLTIGCARCHDHKFDPIRQSDYYALYATFSGVRHGSKVVATPEQLRDRAAKLGPLNARRGKLDAERNAIQAEALKRGQAKRAEYEAKWIRPRTDRLGTEDRFPAVTAKFLRLVSEGSDTNPGNRRSFNIDEFEVWSTEPEPRNVALTAHGGTATGASRIIEDFPGAYGPQKANDGKLGERFLATGGMLTIELREPTGIERVVFSSAKGEPKPGQSKFAFLADYRIEVSTDGETWTVVATSHDRQPVSEAHRNHRLRQAELTNTDRKRLAELNAEIAKIDRERNAIPNYPRIWVGSRSPGDAKGPFQVFIGGSPQRRGEPVAIDSLAAIDRAIGDDSLTYALDDTTPEADRRMAFANWVTHPNNPLTARVLANRVWHYHFGTGLVDTPNDFGYMGGRPTHPRLLDLLADELRSNGWRLKDLHRIILRTGAYRRSSTAQERALKVDANSRLLWRFPPRRLSAEELRDTMLTLAGKLNRSTSETDPKADLLLPDGGPGFRLYQYLQDNVATYVPLDKHGPETYRRAVYHQNARAAPIDLMTEFDQPDCAFSAPRRSKTTTPLQALTLLNHSFTLDMAEGLANRLRAETDNDPQAIVNRVYLLCYGRSPSENERRLCVQFLDEHDLPALCRVLLNTSELITIR